MLSTRRYGTMYGVPGITSSRVPRNATGPPHFGAIGKQCLDIADDMERNALRRCRIVLGDVGPQRRKVGNCLRRPNRVHELLGIGLSSAPPQDATQSLT